MTGPVMTDLKVTHFTAVVRDPTPEGRARWDDYRVSWLPFEGWWCTCGAKRCRHAATVRALAGEKP